MAPVLTHCGKWPGFCATVYNMHVLQKEICDLIINICLAKPHDFFYS